MRMEFYQNDPNLPEDQEYKKQEPEQNTTETNRFGQEEKHDAAPPPHFYQWNATSYYSTVTPPKKAKSGSAFLAVGLSLCSIFVFALFSAGVYFLVSDRQTSPFESFSSSQSSVISGDNSEKNEPGQTDSNAEVTITSTPDLSIASLPPSGTALSPRQIAQKAIPSVVYIIVHEKDEDTPTSLGSGIIMSEDGYIITNAHVVSGAKYIKITTHTNQEFNAKIVGTDPKSDLAVIKITDLGENKLTMAEFGQSSKLFPGDQAMVIGTPLATDFSSTVTLGIVSATDRYITTTDETYALKCIQTDAAINPGNSGGPLVNQYGQVVGISSAKIAVQNFEGMCFAISMDFAKPILDDLVQYGVYKNRAKMGVSFYEISESYAKEKGMPAGLKVGVVDPNYDAAKQGLAVDDIITHVEGKKVTSKFALTVILVDKKPGDTMALTVQRPSENGEAYSKKEIVIKLSSDAA